MFKVTLKYDKANKICQKLNGVLSDKKVRRGKVIDNFSPIPIHRSGCGNTAYVFNMLEDVDRKSFLKRCVREGFMFDVVVFFNDNSFVNLNKFMVKSEYKESIVKILQMLDVGW